MNAFSARSAVRGLLLALILALGCLSDFFGAAAFADVQPAKRLKIALVPKMLNNPVFEYAHVAAQARAEKLRKEGKADIEVLWQAPLKDDPARQADIVRDFIAEGVHGIAISCANASILRQPIDEAVEAGIPVVTWDSDSPRSKRLAYYGINDVESGKQLGQELARLLGKKGTVAILSGVQGAPNLQLRMQGVESSLQEHPEIHMIGRYYCNDDLAKSVQILRDVQQEHPDLSGWAFVGGWPLFASNGLDAITPGKTKVVSYDTLPETLHWLDSNHCQVLMGQKYFGWGAESLQILVDVLADGKKPANWFNDSGVDRVTRENLAQYRETWKKMAEGK